MGIIRGLRAGRVLRGMGVLWLAGGVCLGQPGITGPPACPGTESSVHPAARPTAESIRKTAEAGAADPSVLVAAEPVENFGVARYRVRDYADCVGIEGCYWADLDAQTRRAEAALDRLVATRKPGERLAMVLDIDETTLSGYCFWPSMDYGFLKAMQDVWIVSPEARVVIPGTLRLYRHAQAAGVAVFFVTGRPEPQREGTARNLAAAGFSGWTGLRLRDPAKTQTTQEYKTAERAKIVAEGYRLVLNMGDQWSDLNGDPRGETSVKLPNPFYYLP